MTRKELISAISKKTGLSRVACGRVMDVFAEEVTNCIVRGEKFYYQNLITIYVTELPARKGKNPQTNEVVLNPPCKKIRCKISETIKNRLIENTMEKN